MSNEKWLQNIETALSFNIPHISSYALTVEPKTALHKMIKSGSIPTLDDDLAQQHFHILIDKLQENGFVHYELSNFGQPDYFSKNNTAYWLGKNILESVRLLTVIMAKVEVGISLIILCI